MIIEYHRPKTLDEALALLARTSPKTVPLGGGTGLNHWMTEPTAVVDLQSLPLNSLSEVGKGLELGATVTLQEMVENESLPPALREAAHRELGLNLRNSATLAGTLVTADGRSPLATVLLAMDARLVWLPENHEVAMSDWLPKRDQKQPGYLITKIILPERIPVGLQMVARTPGDRPILVVSVTKWEMGRTRVAVGGFGTAPILAMDKVDSKNAISAVTKALIGASDEWASATYRQAAAAALVERLIS